jgi:hypothetical protein
MSVRVGVGFRLSRHVWLGYSVPLGHARRLAAHEGHFDPLGTLLGLVIVYVMLRTLWAVMWNGV